MCNDTAACIFKHKSLILVVAFQNNHRNILQRSQMFLGARSLTLEEEVTVIITIIVVSSNPA